MLHASKSNPQFLRASRDKGSRGRVVRLRRKSNVAKLGHWIGTRTEERDDNYVVATDVNKQKLRVSPSGKAGGFQPSIRGFDPHYPLLLPYVQPNYKQFCECSANQKDVRAVFCMFLTKQRTYLCNHGC